VSRLSEPNWVSVSTALQIVDVLAEIYPQHRIELVRRCDLEAALQRPVNRFNLGRERDLPRLAAEYVYGIGKAHALVDGNKRLSFQAALVFLELNSLQLNEPADGYYAVYIKELMAGRINIEMLTLVFGKFVAQLDPL